MTDIRELQAARSVATPTPISHRRHGDGETAPVMRSLRARLVWRRLPWWLEVATMGVCYLIYEATRALTAPQKSLAFAHGADVLHIERWAHLDPEFALNRLLNSWDTISDVAGYYYSTCHFVVTPLVLIYLWWRHPQAYPRLRSALVITTAIGLLVFVTWPVAPPRFMAHGFTDTLVRYHIMGMSNPHGVTGLINQYAAMPSLHVGWAIWCAAAIVVTSRSRWRHLAWLYPATTTFVVMATANHYLLDAAAGAALVLAAIALLPAASDPPLRGVPVGASAGEGRDRPFTEDDLDAETWTGER